LLTSAPTIATQPALWQQLAQVERVLAAVKAGHSIAVAVERLPVAARPGVQAIAYAVLRRYGLAEKLMTLLVQRKPTAMTAQFLLIGLALAARVPRLHTDPVEPDLPHYDAHTLVNQVVEAVRRQPSIGPQSGFVNGCLRRFLREHDDFMEVAWADSIARWNHPSWWIDRLKKDYPQQWKAILVAGSRKAGLTLRVNRRKKSVDLYLQDLAAAGLGGRQIGPDAIQMAQALSVHKIPGFAEGHVSVQDAGAQMAADLLLANWQSPPRPLILDACAAPGGKAAHLLERIDCELLAIDIDQDRTARISDTMNRLGLTAQIITADAANPSTWAGAAVGHRQFDAIVLDAPCSASGIVRRHPDIPWQRRESDIKGLGDQQARLLQGLWPLLKPGGRLLFCTCSVFKEEGTERLSAFLAKQADAQVLGTPRQLLPGAEDAQEWTEGALPLDHDGFFYALLHKAHA
jgi:16S rRNA (cytosine967-C5)-methyltransferase